MGTPQRNQIMDSVVSAWETKNVTISATASRPLLGYTKSVFSVWVSCTAAYQIGSSQTADFVPMAANTWFQLPVALSADDLWVKGSGTLSLMILGNG